MTPLPGKVLQSARQAGSRASQACMAIVRLPRRLASRLLRALLGYLRAHPGLKHRVARVLRHSEILDARLRLFARGNPVAGIPAPPHAVPGNDAQAQVDMQAAPVMPEPDSAPAVPAPTETLAANELTGKLRQAVARWPLGKRVHD